MPWNPVRLEQRMGRIHRYGQEHDCLILNFVSTNTREGQVLRRLLERLREIRRELGTDQVFDVVGEVFPSNLLERLFRDLYARKVDVPGISAASGWIPSARTEAVPSGPGHSAERRVGEVVSLVAASDPSGRAPLFIQEAAIRSYGRRETSVAGYA